MLDENTEEEIRILQLQAIALLALVFAYSLGVYITLERIKLKKSGIFDRERIAKLDRLRELVSLIILLVALYFLYRGFITYKKDPTKANKLFLISFVVIVLGDAIMYLSIKYGEEEHSEEEI